MELPGGGILLQLSHDLDNFLSPPGHLGVGGCEPCGVDSRAPRAGADILFCLPAATGWPCSRWGGSCSSSAWIAHARTASWWRRCVEPCRVGLPSSVVRAWPPSWRKGGKTRGLSAWRSLWAWTAPCTNCTLSECLQRAGSGGCWVREWACWIGQTGLSPGGSASW